MARGGAGHVDIWRSLAKYRQRYSIEQELAPINSLEQSINRRLMRASALVRTIEHLESELDTARASLAAVQSEIEGSRAVGALLLEEILQGVRIAQGEAWSPAPVHGFRVWRIEDDRVMGNQLHWREHELEATCLREIPGEDLPHPVDRCGPPACGIYAVKDLAMFPSEVSGGLINRSVVGVVAMTGKVIEHELGYRAARARVVALCATIDGRTLITDDEDDIRAVFAGPGRAVPQDGPTPSAEEVRDYLRAALEKEETWT